MRPSWNESLVRDTLRLSQFDSKKQGVVRSIHKHKREGTMDKIERYEKAQAFQEWAKSVKWEPATKRTKLVGLNERLSR